MKQSLACLAIALVTSCRSVDLGGTEVTAGTPGPPEATGGTGAASTTGGAGGTGGTEQATGGAGGTRPDAALDARTATDVTADPPDGGARDVESAGNVVNGAVRGMPFPVAKAYWIGMPDPELPPVNFFLLEPPLTCAEISRARWDKGLGSQKVLEVSIPRTTAGTYRLGAGVVANYLAGSYNPDARTGQITITAVRPGQNLTGTFELSFGADTIEGSFDAQWCPSGMTP